MQQSLSSINTPPCFLLELEQMVNSFSVSVFFAFMLQKFTILLVSWVIIIIIIDIFILLSRESDQCAVRARLGAAGHLSTTLRWGNPAKCLSRRHNK